MPSSSDAQPTPPARPNPAAAAVKITRKARERAVILAVDNDAWEIDAEPPFSVYTTYLANEARYGRPLARRIMLADYLGPDVMLALNQHANEAETRAVFDEAQRRFDAFAARVAGGELAPPRVGRRPVA